MIFWVENCKTKQKVQGKWIIKLGIVHALTPHHSRLIMEINNNCRNALKSVLMGKTESNHRGASFLPKGCFVASLPCQALGLHTEVTQSKPPDVCDWVHKAPESIDDVSFCWGRDRVPWQCTGSSVIYRDRSAKASGRRCPPSCGQMSWHLKRVMEWLFRCRKWNE